MNSIVRRVTGFVTRASHYQMQQERGIRVKVYDGNLDKALKTMQRKMQSSGMERLIKQQQRHHLKNSEKKVLARKNLERRIRSIDFARKLQSILIKKVRYILQYQAREGERRSSRSNTCPSQSAIAPKVVKKVPFIQ